MTSTINAFLFDLGSVIVDVHLDNFLPVLGLDGQISVDETIAKYESSGISNEFELGRISFDEFHERSCRLFGIEFEKTRFHSAWKAIIGDEKPGMFDLIRQCAQHAPVYLLSNTNKPHFEEALRISPALQLMNHFFLSYELQLLKPDPRIYTETINRIGIPGYQIFFTDDREDNIESAIQAGLQAVQFHSVGQLNTVLKNILD